MYQRLTPTLQDTTYPPRSGIASWLEGFHDTEGSVRKTVAAITGHPLVPRDVDVRGFVIDSVTGELTEIH